MQGRSLARLMKSGGSMGEDTAYSVSVKDGRYHAGVWASWMRACVFDLGTHYHSPKLTPTPGPARTSTFRHPNRPTPLLHSACGDVQVVVGHYSRREIKAKCLLQPTVLILARLHHATSHCTHIHTHTNTHTHTHAYPTHHCLLTAPIHLSLKILFQTPSTSRR